MEEQRLFSTLTSLNAETPKLDSHNKVPGEIGAVIEKMMNISENFGVYLQL